MALLYALGLLCVAAAVSGAPQKTSEAIIDGFTLNCDKPLVFNGKDDEAACFSKCTPGKCQAVVHMHSGQPGAPTCAQMPAGAKCTPEQARGPYNLKFNFPTKKEFTIRKSHNIGGGGEGSGSIAFYHPTRSTRSGSDACFAICQFLGCNAIQNDSDHCALFKFTKRPEVLIGGMDGKSRMCHARTLVDYEDEKIAPTGKCVAPG